jgi:DNA-binding response OmpR family regulator
MVMARAEFRDLDPPPSVEGGGSASARLNLLLSYAGWQSEPWVDQLPRLLEPMGVSSLRAGTGREATELIRSHRIHVAVVDLGLPLDVGDTVMEEGGPRLLELLSRLEQAPPTVAVKSSRTQAEDRRCLNAALRLGVFAVIDRPRGMNDLNVMLEVLRRALCRFYRGRWPAAEGEMPSAT